MLNNLTNSETETKETTSKGRERGSSITFCTSSSGVVREEGAFMPGNYYCAVARKPVPVEYGVCKIKKEQCSFHS